MNWRNYIWAFSFLAALIFTDWISLNKETPTRIPASQQLVDQLESQSLFNMNDEGLKKIDLDEILETKWNRIKRVGVRPSQVSNDL